MDSRRGTEPLDAAEHARARQALLVRPVHDLGVQRLVVVPVGLADVDGDPPGRAVEPHWPPPVCRLAIRADMLAANLAAFMPHHTAASAATMLLSA